MLIRLFVFFICYLKFFPYLFIYSVELYSILLLYSFLYRFLEFWIFGLSKIYQVEFLLVSDGGELLMSRERKSGFLSLKMKNSNLIRLILLSFGMGKFLILSFGYSFLLLNYYFYLHFGLFLLEALLHSQELIYMLIINVEKIIKKKLKMHLEIV